MGSKLVRRVLLALSIAVAGCGGSTPATSTSGSSSTTSTTVGTTTGHSSSSSASTGSSGSTGHNTSTSSSSSSGSTTSATTTGSIGSTGSSGTTATGVVAVSVTPASSTIALGTHVQLTATAVSSDGSTQDVSSTATWTTSDATIATVSSSGLVTPVASGTATITATDGAKFGTASVTVTDATLQSIQVSGPEVALALGTTEQLAATGTFSDGSTQDLTNDVTWSSSTATVADVDSSGLVTADASGSTTITATDATTSKSGSMTIAVTNATLVSLDVEPSAPSIAQGTTQQFTATGTFSDGSTQDLTLQVTWASDATSFATIDPNGLAHGKAAGTANISATSGAVSASVPLTVTSATLVSIAVSPNGAAIASGTTQQLTATGTFSDGTTSDLTAQVSWTSSDDTIASVSNDSGTAGLATAVAAGSVTLTATDSDSGVTGTATLTVTSAALTSIAVTPLSASIASGTTQRFAATGTFSDGSTQDVTSLASWTSSDDSIATVSNAAGTQGLAMGGDVGTAMIVATVGNVSGQASLGVTDAVLVSIEVDPASDTIVSGTTINFTATGTYSDGNTQDITTLVTWTSSTPAVATISNASGSEGTATGAQPGLTTITATDATTGVHASASLGVSDAVLVQIDVSAPQNSLPVGQTEQLTATGTYSDGSTRDITNAVSWSADDPTELALSNAAGSRGQAKGLAQGSPNAIALDPATGVSGSLSVDVEAAVLVSIQVQPQAASTAKGSTFNFTAKGTFSDGSTSDVTTSVTWASSNDSIATISSDSGTEGQATGVSVGTVSITATSDSIVGTGSLAVTSANLVSIAVTPATPTIAKGTTQQFVATGTYSDGSTLDITSLVNWSSSNTGFGTISNTAGTRGLATGVSGGQSTIKATDAATGISGSTLLTVSAASLVSITVTPADATIVVGMTKAFTATGKYSDGSTQNITTTVTWSSDTTSVATIANTGVATGVAAGGALITAKLGSVTSGSATLSVQAKALVSIAVTPNPVAVTAGSTQQLTATGTYNDGSTANVTTTATWVSADVTVAKVSATGLATGVSNGGSTSIYAVVGSISGSTSVVTADGTVLDVNGVSHTILYELCGNGTNTNCTAAVAAASCTNVGRKLVSHASDGSSSVVSLGATQSCQWSISYFTNSSSTVAGQCLIGVSNDDWSQCCTPANWHGNIVQVPTTLNQQFGYVDPNNSGYNAGKSNVPGTEWGCIAVSQAPPTGPGGCTQYYVACE